MSSSPDFKPTVFQFTPTSHHEPYPFISPANQDLTGRAVFITGASKGIGRATAIAFAAAGASHIALGARSALGGLVGEMGGAARRHGHGEPEVLSLVLDVADVRSVEAAGREVERAFGRLDILINNAGYLERFVKVAESDPSEWWKGWEVNLKGTYLVTRAVLPVLLATDGGLKTVLNVSSVGALRQRPGASGYQTAKLAVLRFGEFLNAEYGEQGLLSYGAHPGGVMTELSSAMPKETHGLLNDKAELGAETFVWLTAHRREWLAGRYLSVNWDMEEFEKIKERVVREDLLKVRVVA